MPVAMQYVTSVSNDRYTIYDKRQPDGDSDVSLAVWYGDGAFHKMLHREQRQHRRLIAAV